ncbi:hypothetical protein BI004_gp166 [Bacillus phage NotTheCreek]|uniref:Uncharacterized protein n=2 Tax=Wphvirus TaxID=1922327 RepID=A0A222Z4A9_9CAUD|nr:hypothetical protein BI004_gp166 [Bacillus phage NotTheCreek]YP_009285113.1 hypothetical protein BIZ88_gp171 [Bacillus phage DirtyBetty]ASR78425.1 hypothetical protein PPISBEST_168 [Bacillus phage PPIsBest]QDH50149.1 hypothetical protein ALPS_163 [Bacillus phage ALPS]ULF49372.1 hypothetical protein [Bacillus phage MrBubbles]AMW63385.1 hypothetical protein NOTTHECREEK_166 [Bacillus phage NotTheCreek]ANT41316.1 hypothetical protein DIRTYBETTY_171 [Bacillus phage DirtyBetty]
MRRVIDSFDVDGTGKDYISVTGFLDKRTDNTKYVEIELDITDYDYESSIMYMSPTNARELGRTLIELANKTEEEFIKCQLVDKK